MINRLIDIFKKNSLWFIVIIMLNILFGALLWLIDTRSFVHIFPVMIIGSLIIYFSTVFIIFRIDLKKEEAASDFLNEPSIDNEYKLLRLFNGKEKLVIKQLGEVLRGNQELLKDKNAEINEYEEYIEAWAHEIKTPLGLMTFILDNRKDELSPSIYNRLEYTRTKMQENIERMLYYARIKSTVNDYFFKELSLKESCLDVIEEYSVILQEQGISIIMDDTDYNVVSDKKGIEFILRQIISNSIKYKNVEESNPQINISCEETEKAIILTIRDNGIGVKPYDLPFIFEKGFTGEIGEQRKNSTGMGLYIAQQVAESLKVDLDVSENYTDGFEISMSFPKVS